MVENFRKDAITGAYAREHLLPKLKQRIIDAGLRKEKLSILLIDIDRFKQKNEKYGHLWGDEFLKFEISTLCSTLQEKGLIFRFGGDNFVVIFATTNPQQAFLLSKQFNLSMEKRPFIFNGRLFRVSTSCGLATYPDDAKDTEGLLSAADQALYFSKRYRRNTTICASRIIQQKLKMATLIILELFLIAALAVLIHSYSLKSDFRNKVKSLLIDKLVSLAVKADTMIILENEVEIRARIIVEDQDKLVVITPLDKKDTKLILRNLEQPSR